MAVIRAGEGDDALLAGGGAGNADGRHDGFGARVAECDPLHAGELADQPRDLCGVLRLRTDLNAVVQLLLDGADDERRLMAEEGHAEAHAHVDVLVAVDVPERRALRARSDDGI